MSTSEGRVADPDAVHGKLAERQPEAQQRRAAGGRRKNLALAAVAIMLLAGLGWWLTAAVTRYRAAAREQRIAAERQAAFEAACMEGDRLLAAKRWADAEAAFRQASAMPGYEHAPQPAAGMKSAHAGGLAAEKQASYSAAVAAAQRAAASSDWTTAEREVGKALAVDAKGGEALALADRLVPTLTVTAELEGQAVAGATISIGGAVQQRTTPATYRLDRGKTYAFAVTLPPANGRFFTTAETTVTADWRGPRTWTTKLEVFRGPVGVQPWTVPGLGMELVYVAPGSFQMGSNDGKEDERPVHTVRISKGFWLGKYEVTQAEYVAVVGTNPSFFKGARYPVGHVCWTEAAAFCAGLTERERAAGRLPAGYEYRLPTEAEWEYAARGGAQGRGLPYPGSNNVDEVAWHMGNSGDTTHPVGLKKPNELGLYDMCGNVIEWCLDWYDESYYAKSPVTAPLNLQAGDYRVTRGGSMIFSDLFVSSATRFPYLVMADFPVTIDVGFRACLAPQIQGAEVVLQPSPAKGREQAAEGPGPVPEAVKMETTASGPAEGQPWTVPGLGMEFVWVGILNLWVGKYEVTNGEYRAKEPSHDSGEFEGRSLNGDRQPVVGVRGHTDDYAEWLTQREQALGHLPRGQRFRLPTDAEWQAFARCGGFTSDAYPWGGDWPPTYGNYAGEEVEGVLDSFIAGYRDGSVVSCAVEQSGRNSWGLYGVGGNVSEHCTRRTAIPLLCDVYRGGGWKTSIKGYLRTSFDGSRTSSYDCCGFRLVLSR
jgi:formylglycine-generating enzyme required for sulfatase activity